MTQPVLTITELDGALGVLPPNAGGVLAVVGPCSSGTANVPQAYGRVTPLVEAMGRGPLVEAAALHIDRTGKPAIVCKTGATTVGSYPAADAVTFAGTGTSVVTVDDSTEPDDDYQVVFVVVAGGTIGVTGITFRYSLDGGTNYSALTALGTASTYTIPNTGGIVVEFAAGTLVAGDTWDFLTLAPCWSTAELTAALEALRLSTFALGVIEIVGPMDAAGFDAVEAKRLAFIASGKYVTFITHARVPVAAESEATYKAALDTIFSAKSSTGIAVTAGAGDLISAVSGRQYVRPFGMLASSIEAAASEEINTADINLGALAGFSVRDANGNPNHHDESANPGLDDSRFYVARTWEGYPGVYVNRPRLFSSEGSDYQLVPHRRVLNLAHGVWRNYFLRRLNKPIIVSKTTGYILEEEALEIEYGALRAAEAALLAKPKASGVLFVLSRTDNLLSTKTLTGSGRVIPLAYPEYINLDVGFFNPALQIVAV